MFGSVILEVFIGLSFVYVVVSLICSAINEFIATAFNRRAGGLERALQTLLGAQFEAFLSHPQVSFGQIPGKKEPLHRKAWRRLFGFNASYLSARDFFLAIVDLNSAPPPVDGSSRRKTDSERYDELKQTLGKIQNDSLRRALLSVHGHSKNSFDDARKNIEEMV